MRLIKRVELIKNRSWQQFAFLLFLFVSCALLASVAQADPLGADGGPTGSDYLSSGTGFAGNLGPILKNCIGFLLCLLAVWTGPRIIYKLVMKVLPDKD